MLKAQQIETVNINAEDTHQDGKKKKKIINKLKKMAETTKCCISKQQGHANCVNALWIKEVVKRILWHEDRPFLVLIPLNHTFFKWVQVKDQKMDQKGQKTLKMPILALTSSICGLRSKYIDIQLINIFHQKLSDLIDEKGQIAESGASKIGEDLEHSRSKLGAIEE
uniref:Uncharacterized protein n=1 Tax=Romanomermis culicivorax TaxID=13658 RepID=A0A915JWG7_ROMCU